MRITVILQLYLVREAVGVFVFPEAFNGLWTGYPEFSALGPSDNEYIFSVSSVANGDSLMEVNLVLDDFLVGWQRFYIEGAGKSPGELWYCGELKNFSMNVEQAGAYYPDAFTLFSQSDESITWCLDTNDPAVADRGLNSPFMSGCELCDCANWTLTLVPNEQAPGGYTLNSLFLNSAAPGHSNAKHLSIDMTLAGPAPVIDDSNWPNMSDFTCDFEGRDGVPIDRSSSALDNGVDKRVASKVGCPLARLSNGDLKRGHEVIDKKVKEKQSKSRGKSTDTDYDFCYTLNDYSNFQLSWSLNRNVVDIQISASAPDDTYYVALGFRPMSRSSDANLTTLQTGRTNNFGMIGADIVAGFGNGDVQTMYAPIYTGPPELDNSLTVSNSAAMFEPWDQSDPTGGGTTTLKFSRSVSHTGKLNSLGYPQYSNILTDAADMIWAVGSSTNSDISCSYHENTRGLRLVNWERPDLIFPDEWKC